MITKTFTTNQLGIVLFHEAWAYVKQVRGLAYTDAKVIYNSRDELLGTYIMVRNNNSKYMTRDLVSIRPYLKIKIRR